MKKISRRQFLLGRAFMSDADGTTPIEYGILAAGIGVAGYSALQYLGNDTKTLYKCIGDAIALKSADGKCTDSGGAMAGAKDT